ncbi:excisionase family DNA binding protein [Propionibacteriaceae bacterium ES.041]|uniref:helix-turn-helix domain-containing protein n=1 Tax=Enemella evansiae TaxID=2016499 RepID=UPI000B95DAAE|nr:helix-turn-helix domain-containing protein [Enemella evansiae]PFG68775.1 excisionase family DNA binding protein [Propionibacteriaceae bacterium ES.041]OYN97097.1 DNA-binding protein [Enemella evansiae]OYN97175.1 DNA-binding protein [Enemella evansiae]OYO06061.1 DNA-binding protein [Enemella evansiae]OYO13021.1 DNA-binding protein [Enemella evansiae]
MSSAIPARSAGPRTYLPSPESESATEEFAEVLEALATASAARPALVGPHNEQIPLPREAFEVLLQVYEAMKRGLAIHVAPLNAQLTTQEAANYLGISRPTLVKLLESGAIPFIKPARHRYVRIDDLIEYAEQLRTERSRILDDMAQEAQQEGLYEVLDGPPPKMR